jgi:peptide subunit release factor 1 (eRF1)
MSDAEIRVVYKDDAWIDNHHKNGGYSAARFGRIRQEQIKQWHKLICEKLESYSKEFYLDASFVNSGLLEKQMSKKVFGLFKGRVSSGYSGSFTGIYQSIKLLDSDNNKYIKE